MPSRYQDALDKNANANKSKMHATRRRSALEPVNRVHVMTRSSRTGARDSRYAEPVSLWLVTTSVLGRDTRMPNGLAAKRRCPVGWLLMPLTMLTRFVCKHQNHAIRQSEVSSGQCST